MQKQPPAVFYEKTVLKNFATFKAKHQCWSPFNSEYCEIFQSMYFEEHLQAAASENVFIKLNTIKNC